MVANTGTYLDAPFHRYADGADLAELPLASLADLPGIVVRQPWENGLAVDAAHFDGLDVARQSGAGPHRLGPALAHRRYSSDHPFLTAEAADWLVEQWRGAGRHRQPQYRRHARPRAAGAHHAARRRNPDLRAYDQPRRLPDEGFRFSAAPPKVEGMGTFPVRAYAVLG